MSRTTCFHRRPLRAALLAVSVLAAGLAAPALAQDTDPPVIRVLEGGVEIADGVLFDGAVTLVIETTDASPPVDVVATLDGAAFTSGGTVSDEGLHQLAVTATDAVGNPATLDLGFEIDTTPPAFVSVLPPAGTVTSAAEVTLSGEVSGAATLTVDGQSVPLVGGQFTAGPYALAEGTRTFALVATDAAGNAAPLGHDVVRDSTPPSVAITQPAAGAVLGSSSVDGVGTAADPHLATVTVNGVSASITGGTFVALGVPLTEGPNPLTAEAVDAAGNSATAARTVVLDTQPPSVAITDPAPGTVVPDASITISGSAADPHLDRVEVDGVEAQLSGGSWSASVPLAEGPNSVTATAFDALGHPATDSVSVIRDSEAPAIHVELPADGSWHSATEVDVSGTVDDEPGIAVTVNGVEATVNGATFSAAAVALVEGENRLIARVTDAPGNQGAHTRIVYRDTVAPELLAADPAAGALAVPPDARFTLTFDEPMGEPAPGAWRLETAGGTPLPAGATLAGDQLTVQPTAPLPSATSIRLVATAALVDRAGNPLENPQTIGYTTADVEPPDPPSLTGAPPSPVCAPKVSLAGTAEPEAQIEATGGVGTVTVRADEIDGTFTLEVDLRSETLNLIELTATDLYGNASAPASVEVVHDCTPPEVVGAELAAGAFTIDFSEPVAAGSLAGAVSVVGASGAVVGGASAVGGGWQAVFTPDDPLPSEPLELTVATAVADLAGNPLAYPFSALFGAAVTDSFVAGRVLAAATGRPLAGAEVAVVASGGIANPEPVPAQTTGAGGRFSIPVPPGGHHLVITRPGYTPALRYVSAAAGIGADVFDPRLTPAADPVTVDGSGGMAAGTGGASLDVPSGALAAAAPVAVTALGEQALPALLPYGWSPRGAAWIDLGGEPLAAPAELTLPVDAPDGATLPVARLDEATLQWRVEAEASVLGGVVTVAVDQAGAWAAVEGDSGPSAPPAPMIGSPLAASAAPDPALVTAAAIDFDPETVLPAQSSTSTVSYTLAGDPASGVPLTLSVREELTLLDGTVRRPAPFEADLVLYRAPDGTPRSRFQLAPSAEARVVPLEMGAEEVTLRPYGGETLQGGVIGPGGGAVTTPEGDRADLPAGAVAEPTPVSLVRRAEADLPVPLPAEATYLGALALDLAGNELAADAALTLELGAAPGAGEEGLLLAAIDLPAGPAWRPVAELAPTATGWTTAAIDPQDLPWPGVREGGLYVFARLEIPVGFVRGTVTGPGGGPLPGARVFETVAEPPWVQLANPDGSYALPVPVAAVTVLAEDPATLDRALGGATVAAAGDRVDLDLAIQQTGPVLVSVDPPDGATGVPVGIEPLLTFSETLDPSTLAAGVLLYDGADPVPVELEATGATVRLVPQATLRPGAAHEIRANTALKDLQGNRLDAAVTTTFTTQESTANTVLDRSRTHRFEPDGTGMVRVLGRPGAAPAGSLVFVENVSRLVSTPSVDAASDGSFELWIEAAVEDTLLLHVVPPGANETVFELEGSLTPDGRGATVGAGEATSFATLDGFTVDVEAGTFLAPAVVRVEPVPVTEATAPIPADFTYLAAFRLEVEGAEAQKRLGISLPLPPGAVGDEFLLSRIERVLGEDYWMVHDLLRREGDRLTNEAPPEEAGGAVSAGGSASAVGTEAEAAASASAEAAAAASRGSIVGLSAAGQGSGTIQPLAAPARMGDRQEYLPGSANPGLYTVMSHDGLLDWVGIPLAGGVASSGAYFSHLQIEGMIAVVNGAITRLLGRDAILMPTRRGETYTLEGRDLATGYRFFEDTFDPPASGEIVVHPPDVYGDTEPPVPVAGSPVRFFVLTPAAGSTGLAPGLSTTFAGDSLTVTAEPGAAASAAHVRLLGLDDSADQEAVAAADGSFTFTEPAVAGRRYLLAIGAEVGVNEPLEIEFDEGLDASLAGITVLDADGRDTVPEIAFAGDAATVRITPRGGWQAGEVSTLVLGGALADAAGNDWGETLEVGFKVRGSGVLATLDLAEVRDIARLGTWLFLAAGPDGLAVVDATNPEQLLHAARDANDAGFTFPFPFNDPVTAVTIDPHGRVLVVGGGVAGPGLLRIFDPLAFDPGAVAANPSDPAVRYAAFRGSTLVSDALGGGTGTSLPEGTPRRVTVLSDDDVDRWRVGIDPPPAGVTLDPATPPAGGSPYALTVSGADGSAGLPVTLRKLQGAALYRMDAGGAGGWSFTLTAVPGESLELLRNRQTLAYLATLGAGLEVVDVNAFYGETPEDPQNPDLVSDVIGIYTGYQDPNLTLCNQPVSDIASSLIDMGTLFDAADPHPLTLVGLVGFRGVALFESDPVDVGELSFYNDACLEIGGSARVSGMAVVEDYPFDLDGDGLVTAAETRDYLVVTHLTAGVLILDATNRDALELVGRVKLPGSAGEVAVDRDRRLLYVSGLGGGIYVVDFDEAPSVTELDANSDGTDDRVVETIALAGNTNSTTLLVPELGLAFAGGLDRGLTSLGVGSPWVAVMGPDGEGGWVPIERLAPLGVPTATVDGRALPAVFRVMVALPGMVGAETRLDVVSLGPGGLPIAGAGDPAASPGLPPPALAGTEGLVLRRLADEPWQEGYQVYVSDPVVAVADLRAARAYAATADEAALCPRCDGAAEGVPATAPELLSGHSIAIRFPASLRQTLAEVYPASVLDRAERSLASVPWEISPAVRQEPALNPSLGTGDVAPGTLLHSGEYSHAAVDLAVRGRGLDIAFARIYRSRTVGAGPLGPGWELGYRVRLRELPNGDVEHYDGTGRRETFARDGNGYVSPAGVFAELSRTSAGWTLLDAQHNLERFDRWGRRIAVADAVKDSADTGNELRFRYDLAGRLVEVVDDLDRTYSLAYNPAGRLASITDFTGRTVTYSFDADGRLETVTSPPVTIGQSAFPSGLTTTYAYETPPSGDLATRLNARDNLTSVTDPRDVTWLELTYTDADGDGRDDEVTSQTWGGYPLSIVYDFGARTATVTDRRGHPWSYEHDTEGHTTKVSDPSSAAWETTYDAEGLVTLETQPLGRTTAYTYNTSGGRRSRGNLLSVTVTPDGRGDNGSPSSLTTTITYDGRTNLPETITDPRQAVTEIDRALSGLPLEITRALGQPEVSVTEIAYNAFGQPTRVTNPNGHATDYRYATSGPGRGYLEREIVDPNGLALVTRYQTDLLGRVTAVTDARGVRHETVFNELGWMVEQSAAASAATDGSNAPALGYQTVYLYDPNGNLVEERQPFGPTGAQQVKVFREYGVLGELLKVEQEIQPGGERAVWSYEHDEAFRVTQVTDPELHEEQVDYDPRGLPEEIRRGLGGPDPLAEPVVFRPWFDPDRQLGRVTDPRGYVWLTGRDGYGRVASQADPLGNVTYQRYSPRGDLAEIESRDAEDVVLARTELVHDLLGRRTLERRRLWQYGSADPSLPTSDAAAVAVETTYEHDPASNLERVVDPLGRPTTLEYDAAERLTAREDPIGNRQELALDAAGNATTVRSVEQLPGGGTTTVATDFTFDALGRLSEEIDALANRTVYHHDARGNLVRAVDPEGHFTEYTYDGLDRRVSTVRPERIREAFEFDEASRLTAYEDALSNRTTYTWDAADRLVEVTYPDATTIAYQHDPAGNVVQWTDPMGTVVGQTFDAAGRLRVRDITPGTGVAGVTAEGYDYDGLSRLTQAVSGAIVTDLDHDSLGRLLAETTAGKTLRYGRDPAGNATSWSYPSGLELARGFDGLDRLATVGTGATPDSIAAFGYRGPGRRATAAFGNGLTGAWNHDPAGRPTGRRFETALGDPVMAETLAWTPRGLQAASGRGDLNGAGWVLGYDGAGRLLRAADQRVTASTVPNNSTPAAALGPQGHRFSYDPAQSLVEHGVVKGAIESLTAMPSDGSGRNRPGSVLGPEPATLAWNPAGQLAQKRDLTFEYDYRGRLVRVRRQGAEIALYEYDAFNRKVFRTVEGVERQTVWSGMRAVEEYEDGQLSSRRAYGPGLDEIVRLELDVDGDGSLEPPYVPLYDQTGNLAVLTDGLGLAVERYRFDPYGPRQIEVDDVAPQVTQTRVLDQEILIEWSEGLTEEELLEGLAEGWIEILVDDIELFPGSGLLRSPGELEGQVAAAAGVATESGEGLATTAAASGTGDFSVSLPVLEGLHAGRRVAIAFTQPPAAGAEVTVTIHPEAVADAFLNRPSAPWTVSFAWPASDAVVSDTAAPTVEQVTVVDGQLEVALSETPDLASAETAILIDGQPTTWTLGSDGYRLLADSPLAAGTYQLEIGAGLTDLAGNGLAASLPLTLDLSTELSLLAYEAINPRLIDSSAVGNAIGFHGLELDPATGLIYARNRWYDAEIARFTSLDPMGHVDGPNLLQYGLNNPVNFSDPLGLACTTEHGGRNFFCNPMDEMELSSAAPWWQHALAVAAETGGNTLTEGLFLNVFADAPHVVTDPEASGGEKALAGGKAAGAAVLNLGGVGVVVKAGLGRLAATRPVQWTAQRLSRSRFGQRVAGVLMEDVGVLWRRAFRQADEVVEDAGERLLPNAPGEVFHATTSPRAAEGVLSGVDPRFLNPESRFGRAFYVAEQPGTALAELAHHGVAPTHGIRFSLDLSRARVLDLTEPKVAARFRYTGGPITPATQAIGAQALEEGYTVIRYPSLRGSGSNLAILDDFNAILRPQMVGPAQ